MIQPPKAAPIPDGNKAGIAVTEKYVLVSVRRECMDAELAAQITMGMIEAVRMADHPYDEIYRAAGVDEEA